MDDEKMFGLAVRLLEVRMKRYEIFSDKDFVAMIPDLLPDIFMAVEEAWIKRRELQELLTGAAPPDPETGSGPGPGSGLN